MKAFTQILRVSLLASLLGVTLPASAQTLQCVNDLAQDRQPNFSADAGLTLGAVSLTSANQLRLNTGLVALNTEQIILPVDQNVTATYVYESAGFSATVGYFYMDDLVSRGYWDADAGVLLDNDGDGIPDFHEDLFNMSMTRPYVGDAGVGRRCGTTFTTADGKSYRTPDLATDGTCAHGYVAKKIVDDFSPYGAKDAGVVGLWTPAYEAAFGNATNAQFSDNGLFPHVPNLLEPKDPANGFMGLGHIIFLLADDDTDSSAEHQLAPVSDASLLNDGIPDYNVTAYDLNGKPLAVPPDSVINSSDRTVNLGTINGNREIVFYMISYSQRWHNPLGTGSAPTGGDAPPSWGSNLNFVNPCLKLDATGHCLLYLYTPTTVYFTKSALNLDLNPVPSNPVATRDIGCDEATSCSTPTGTFRGWLDNATIARLALAPYNVILPHEAAVVNRPLGTASNRMPHAIVGAPSTNPFVWLLGFEDVAGGGDRDFNDVTILINKNNSGGVVSGVVSSDISPSIAADFTITQVRFTKSDTPFFSPDGTNCAAASPQPSITYSVAVDCKIPDTAGIFQPNPTPHWVPLVFPTGSPDTVTINMLDVGFTGSQLCWKSTMASPNDHCQPTINNVDVGYQAQRAGNYNRGAVDALVNARIYGAYETPGSTWNDVIEPKASMRVYDARPDFTPRGHLYFDSVYNPDSNPPVWYTARTPVWDAAVNFTSSGFDPDARKVYTSDSSNNRVLLTQTATAAKASLFNVAALCPFGNAYDLDGNSVCDANDQGFLLNWLLGWEDKRTYASPPAFRKRAWLMGGLDQATPALSAPPGNPVWFNTASSAEQSKYTTNFANPLATRRLVTFTNTTQGVVHAFDSGLWAKGDDATCTGYPSYRGHFERTGGASSCTPGTRDYGDGHELFAYMPRSMLSNYVTNYTLYDPLGTTTLASLNAHPVTEDVDLGGMSDVWLPSAVRAQGAKTVLVSATGSKNPIIFGLDVSNPTLATYPVPMFEYDMSTAVSPWGGIAPAPDSRGSHFAPAVGRLDFGAAGKIWTAVVATDYVPNSATAGAVYFINLKTGLPILIAAGKPLIVPLQAGEGLSGTPVLIDANQDGTFDTVYVASTGGNVYRLSTLTANATLLTGLNIPVCLLGNTQLGAWRGVPTTENIQAHGALASDRLAQRVYAGIAARLDPTTATTVRIFVGTADSPDDSADAVATAYYLESFIDPNPLADSTKGPVCTNADPDWIKRLGDGQRVWGGVTINETSSPAKDTVAVATAVGASSNVCDLSTTVSGQYYALSQTSGALQSSASLGGQSLSRPTLYDGTIILQSTAGPLQKSSASGPNQRINPGKQSSHVLMWDLKTDGKLPQ